MRKFWTFILVLVLVCSAVALSACSGLFPDNSDYDYFNSVYDLKSGHVFDTIVWNQFNMMLDTSGTFLVLYGGHWSAATRAAIPYINDMAKKYEVPVIYNFDPKLDGGIGETSGIITDISNPQNGYANVTTDGAGTFGDPYSTLMLRMPKITDVFLKDSENTYVGKANYTQFNPDVLVNKDEAAVYENYEAAILPTPALICFKGVPRYTKKITGGATAASNAADFKASAKDSVVAYFDGTVGNDADAYKTGLEKFFDECYGRKDSKNTIVSSLANVISTFDYYAGTGFNIGGESRLEEACSVFDAITYHELTDMLKTRKGSYPLMFGGEWCSNTQGIGFVVDEVAKARGWAKVPMFDTILNGTYGTHMNIRDPDGACVYNGLYAKLFDDGLLGDYASSWNKGIKIGITVGSAVKEYTKMCVPCVMVITKNSKTEKNECTDFYESELYISETWIRSHPDSKMSFAGITRVFTKVEQRTPIVTEAPAASSGEAPTVSGGC